MRSLQSLTHSTPVKASFWSTVILLIYKAVDAAGNIEFILQKAGIDEGVAKFFGSGRGIDFLLALSLLVLVVTVAYKVRHADQIAEKESDVGEKIDSEVERNIQIQILNNARLESDKKATALEQRLRVSQDQLDGVSWAHERAREQVPALQRFIKATNCQIVRSELNRSHPCIDFQFVIENYSVYDVLFTGDLSGLLQYANIPLVGKPKWISDIPNVAHGKQKSGIIRFTMDDAENVKMISQTDSSFSLHAIKSQIEIAPGDVKTQTYTFVCFANAGDLRRQIKALSGETWRRQALKNHNLVFQCGGYARAEMDGKLNRVAIATDLTIQFEKKPEPAVITGKKLEVELYEQSGSEVPQKIGSSTVMSRVAIDPPRAPSYPTLRSLIERPEGHEVVFEGLEFTEQMSPTFRFKSRTVVYDPVTSERAVERGKHFLRLTLEASNQEPLSMDLDVDWGIHGVLGGEVSERVIR